MYGNARGDNKFTGTLGPGTTVVSNAPATVKRIIWPGTYVGTFTIHDAASAAGTNSTSTIFSLPIPAAVGVNGLEINYRCKSGIVVQETGTPNHTLIWGE